MQPRAVILGLIVIASLLPRQGIAGEWSIIAMKDRSGKILACNVIGLGIGDTSLALVIDRQRPATIQLYLGPPDGVPPFPAALAVVTFAFSDHITLKAQGRGFNDGYQNGFRADLSPADLPQWIHELTAASTVTMTTPVRPSLHVSLDGSSQGIDNLERCVVSAGIGGVSAPFRAAPGATVPPQKQCFAYGDVVTLDGTITRRPNHAPNIDDPAYRFPALAVAPPICALGGEFSPPEADQTFIEIDNGNDSSAPPVSGRHMTITGTLRHASSKVENGPLIIGRDVTP